MTVSQSKRSELTPRQARFVEEYLIDLNATQAAIRAGYSAKTAVQQGPRLLGYVGIARAIQEGKAERSERTGITADRVLNELAKIGFADIRKAVKWGVVGAKMAGEGDEVIVENAISLIDSDALDDDTAAAIAEVAQTNVGLKIKLHDKRAALTDLGRHLGLFLDRVQHSADADLAALLKERRERARAARRAGGQ